MGSDSDERAPMAEPTTTDHRQPSDGATFLLAIWVPGADHEQDPDVTADEFVHMLDGLEVRSRPSSGSMPMTDPKEYGQRCLQCLPDHPCTAHDGHYERLAEAFGHPSWCKCQRVCGGDQ